MLTNNEPQATQDFFAALHRAMDNLDRAEELRLSEHGDVLYTPEILQALSAASSLIDTAGQAIVDGLPPGEPAPDAVIVEVSA